MKTIIWFKGLLSYKFFIFSFFIFSFYSNKISAQWIEVGGANSLTTTGAGSVISICSDANGNIYAGGYFLNSSFNDYVAKYDGAVWTELGGINSLAPNNCINAVCSDVNGNIYTGGNFTNANGYNYVAKYNGTNWSELGGLNGLAANNPISTICSDATGNIYTAGIFTNSSANRYVAKYDGTTWSELGGLNAFAANGTIEKICSDAAGNIYAAGLFTNSSGKHYVAKYDGTTWSELGGLNGLAANFEIDAICSDAAGNIYAGGKFTNSSSNFYVAKYNGTNWSELGGLNALAANHPIDALCTDAAGNIYAAGDFTNSSGKCYVAKYDGTVWSELGCLNGLAANWHILTLCKNNTNNIFASGGFTNVSHYEYVAEYISCTTAVTLVASATTICSDMPITFTASPTNGGTAPIYNFIVNGVSVQSGGSNTFTTNSLHTGDTIICGMISNTPCVCNDSTYSNAIGIIIKPISTKTIGDSACGAYVYHGVSYNTSGIYHDTLYGANYYGCDSIITLNFTELQPTLYLGVDTAICITTANSIVLNATSAVPNAQYVWNDLSTNPIKIITNSGLYSVVITAPPCAAVSDSIKIIFLDCDCKMLMPNAFSPNADNKNDELKPIYACDLIPENYSLTIYNRWGELLFQTTDFNIGWDGTFHNKPQPVATYIYLVKFTLNQHQQVLKGDVELVR